MIDNILDDILSKILLLKKAEINDNLSRSDIEEWDSMTHLILISEIEQSFDITFEDDDIVSIQTVGDIKKILSKKNV